MRERSIETLQEGSALHPRQSAVSRPTQTTLSLSFPSLSLSLSLSNELDSRRAAPRRGREQAVGGGGGGGERNVLLGTKQDKRGSLASPDAERPHEGPPQQRTVPHPGCLLISDNNIPWHFYDFQIDFPQIPWRVFSFLRGAWPRKIRCNVLTFQRRERAL